MSVFLVLTMAHSSGKITFYHPKFVTPYSCDKFVTILPRLYVLKILARRVVTNVCIKIFNTVICFKKSVSILCHNYILITTVSNIKKFMNKYFLKIITIVWHEISISNFDNLFKVIFMSNIKIYIKYEW